MSRENASPADALELLDKFCEGELSSTEADKLERLVCSDPDVCRLYIKYADLHVELFNRYKTDGTGTFSVADGAAEPICPVTDYSDGIFPTLSPLPSPLSPSFVGGPVFSYMVATVVLCVMLLGAWAHKITHVAPSRPSVVEHENRNSPVFVGQIIGMKDCVWAKDGMGAILGASVPVGREYKLSSGLMEIAYKSGAKVILEGRCEYTVDSRDGGFLRVGKLVARVEKKVASGQWPVESGEKQLASAKPQADASNPKSLIPSPQSPAPSPQPLFSVRTPSAVVTDLGTEFGVEVDKDGATESHVLQGAVDVKILGKTGKEKHISVGAGHAVRVESDNMRITPATFAQNRFMRQLSQPADCSSEMAYIKSVLSDKPLGYWPLNEPGGTRSFRDFSGHGFHGAALGSVSAGEDGPLPGQSRSVAFNGIGYIDIGRQDCFSMANDFTIEAWINADDVAWPEDRPSNARIVSAASGEGRFQASGWAMGYFFAQNGKSPRGNFSVHGCNPGSFLFSDNRLPTTEWAHLVCVFGADNTMRVFLNGKQQVSIPFGKPAIVGPAWVSIGWGANMGGEYWRGRLAHVAIYPRALDESQITRHFRSIKTDQRSHVEFQPNLNPM